MRYVLSRWYTYYKPPITTEFPFLWMAKLVSWIDSPLYQKVEIWDRVQLERR